MTEHWRQADKRRLSALKREKEQQAATERNVQEKPAGAFSEETLPPIRLERRRIRNLNIYLRPPYEEILVTAPLRMPACRIEAFLSEKRGWMLRSLKRLRLRNGKNRLADALSAAERKSLQDRLSRILPPFVAEWEPRIGVRCRGLSYRKMRRCFGICHTKTGVITFNVFLGEAPERLIEYIAVHELCHLKEANHGPRFYALMDRFLPDWRERKREISLFYQR